MKKYIVSITARDRSGIVAGISNAIYEMSGNIVAASQTVHQGYFAMIVMCEVDDDSIAFEDLAGEIKRKAGKDLHVYVVDYVAGVPSEKKPCQTFIVTAVGPDRPGILNSITRYLASKEVNVDDLYCCKEPGGDFTVVCQASVPEGMDVFNLQTDLEAVGKERGVTISMQHENIFVATNELRLGCAR